MKKDATKVVKHMGDCSIYACNPKNGKSCKICDCGALRKAILHAGESSKFNDLWEAWVQHLDAVEKSYGW